MQLPGVVYRNAQRNWLSDHLAAEILTSLFSSSLPPYPLCVDGAEAHLLEWLI